MTSQEKATAASVAARQDKAARLAAYRQAVAQYNIEHVSLPLMPEGTQEQTAQLRGMWYQFRALQDRIKELHTLRGRTGSERRKSTLFEDILAAKMELEDLRLSMRIFRRKMAGAELLAKVDLPEPRPQDYGLKPTDVE